MPNVTTVIVLYPRKCRETCRTQKQMMLIRTCAHRYDEFQTGRTLQPNTSPGKYDEFKSSPTSTISGQTDAEGTYGLVESLVAPAAPPGSKEQTLNYDNFGAGAGLVPVPKPK